MSRQLREPVTITIPGGTLSGYLYVGADGLPELSVAYDHASQVGMAIHTGPLRYRPATLPAEWIVTSSTCGTLYSAWDLIWNLIEEIAIAQREAEYHPYLDGPAEPIASAMLREERESEDDAKERERERATDNRIAEEVDERV